MIICGADITRMHINKCRWRWNDPGLMHSHGPRMQHMYSGLCTMHARSCISHNRIMPCECVESPPAIIPLLSTRTGLLSNIFALWMCSGHAHMHSHAFMSSYLRLCDVSDLIHSGIWMCGVHIVGRCQRALSHFRYCDSISAHLGHSFFSHRIIKCTSKWNCLL